MFSIVWFILSVKWLIYSTYVQQNGFWAKSRWNKVYSQPNKIQGKIEYKNCIWKIASDQKIYGRKKFAIHLIGEKTVEQLE